MVEGHVEDGDKLDTFTTQPARTLLSGELEGCACGFDKRAADRMAAAIDVLVHLKQLDARSLPADARLDYGEPLSMEEAQKVGHEGGVTVPVPCKPTNSISRLNSFDCVSISVHSLEFNVKSSCIATMALGKPDVCL